ncbi:MAG: trypsin-like serine protease [Planctomycetota bacterium]|jgi:hypothetical protein
MNDFRHSALLAPMILLSPVLSAQIETSGHPASMLAGLSPDEVPIEFVQPPDVGQYLAEDDARQNWPMRYGALLEVDIDPQTHGVWDLLEDGTRVWRVKFLSPGAKSLGFELDEFQLSPGSALYLYDDDYQVVHGAYTDVNNQPHGEIAIAPFRGETVILEYVEPARSGSSRLGVGTVIYDYRDVFELERELVSFSGGGTAEGSCYVDVNCPEGDAYPTSKRAVMRTLSGGGLCSGALINNTSNDGTQYVLTAWHCGQSSNTVFRFNYQTSGCGTGSAPTNQQVSGCTVLASSQSADGRLLRINTPIPAEYGPYHAAWTLATSNPPEAYGMHHPAGLPKKLSYDGNGLTKQSVTISGIGTIPSWRAGFNYGGVTGGSSGSPIFDRDDRVRGFLSGGPQTSCPTTAYYGRLDRFWAFVDIAQYLDPGNTGANSAPGLDPYNPDGGPTTPTISSLEPPTLTPVVTTTPFQIDVVGDGFLATTAVELDGAPVGFSVVDDSRIRLSLLGPFALGNRTVTVIEGADTDSITLPVTQPASPVIDLVNSDPGILIQILPLTVYVSSGANDLHVLVASTDNNPSSFPGLFDLGIGSNLTTAVAIGNFAVDPVTGYTQIDIPVSGLAIGTKLYFQSVVLPAVAPSFPLATSNIESGTIFF